MVLNKYKKFMGIKVSFLLSIIHKTPEDTAIITILHWQLA